MVSPTAQPPVCKIIDFGRYKYTTEKQQKEGKRKPQEVKGIKISPRIAEHDLSFLTKKGAKFLEEGHKVKITCMFRAREVTHPEIGRRKLEAMAAQVADISVIERSPTMDGRLMIMVLNPKPQTIGKQKHAKTEDKQNGSQEVQNNGDRQDNAPEVVQQPHVPAQERGPEEAPRAGA